MMGDRLPVRLFPQAWRDRHGEEFAEHFAADPHRAGKWFDAVRTAGGLHWRARGDRNDAAVALLLVAGLVAVACDMTLGVVMDAPSDPALLIRHWWGAPFVIGLATSAMMAIVGAGLALTARWRSVLRAALTLGGFTALGSVAAAALAFDLAASGAGLGLVAGAAAVRLRQRCPPARRDVVVAFGVAVTVVLGWRSAGSPLGPLVLLVLLGCLTSARPPAPTPPPVLRR